MNARPAGRLGLLIAGLATSTHCGPPPTLEIRFIGNAAFELTDGRTTLLVDFPYESGTAITSTARRCWHGAGRGSGR